MSDHTQAIPVPGKAQAGKPSQSAQAARGNPSKSSGPSTAEIPAARGGTTSVRGWAAGGAAPAARQAAPAAPRTSDRALESPRTGVATETGNPATAVGRPAPTTTSGKKAGGSQRTARAPRKARLQLRHIDTWSALKISLVLSIVMFFVWMVAVGILYGVLSELNVFDQINELIGQLGEKGNASDVVTPGLVFGGAAVVGAVNIVLFTALFTIATYIYNLCADLVGGLEVTLTERE